MLTAAPHARAWGHRQSPQLVMQGLCPQGWCLRLLCSWGQQALWPVHPCVGLRGREGCNLGSSKPHRATESHGQPPGHTSLGCGPVRETGHGLDWSNEGNQKGQDSACPMFKSLAAKFHALWKCPLSSQSHNPIS